MHGGSLSCIRSTLGGEGQELCRQRVYAATIYAVLLMNHDWVSLEVDFLSLSHGIRFLLNL